MNLPRPAHEYQLQIQSYLQGCIYLSYIIIVNINPQVEHAIVTNYSVIKNLIYTPIHTNTIRYVHTWGDCCSNHLNPCLVTQGPKMKKKTKNQIMFPSNSNFFDSFI